MFCNKCFVEGRISSLQRSFSAPVIHQFITLKVVVACKAISSCHVCVMDATWQSQNVAINEDLSNAEIKQRFKFSTHWPGTYLAVDVQTWLETITTGWPSQEDFVTHPGIANTEIQVFTLRTGGCHGNLNIVGLVAGHIRSSGVQFIQTYCCIHTI